MVSLVWYAMETSWVTTHVTLSTACCSLMPDAFTPSSASHTSSAGTGRQTILLQPCIVSASKAQTDIKGCVAACLVRTSPCFCVVVCSLRPPLCMRIDAVQVIFTGQTSRPASTLVGVSSEQKGRLVTCVLVDCCTV